MELSIFFQRLTGGDELSVEGLRVQVFTHARTVLKVLFTRLSNSHGMLFIRDLVFNILGHQFSYEFIIFPTDIRVLSNLLIVDLRGTRAFLGILNSSYFSGKLLCRIHHY